MVLYENHLWGWGQGTQIARHGASLLPPPPGVHYFCINSTISRVLFLIHHSLYISPIMHLLFKLYTVDTTLSVLGLHFNIGSPLCCLCLLLKCVGRVIKQFI